MYFSVYSAPASTEKYSGVVISSIDASDVEWASTGTGSQNRSVQSKLDDVIVNVFDFMSESQIAAIRAGTSTNDTAQIQAAVDYAGTLDTNVMIVFPPGTYEVTQITFSNASFGSDGYTLCIDGSNRAARLNFNGTNIQSCFFFDYSVGYGILGKVRVQNIHLQGAAGIGNGILSNALSWGLTIENCQISNFIKNVWLRSAIFPRIINC